MVMAVFIIVREGTLVMTTLAPALPTTWPQVVFILVMIAFGTLAGRVSKNAEQTHAELVLTQGAGI
jgi:hypothetical protein